jgi:hypothetical protein
VFNSTVLDLGIGLIFAFLAVSLLSSAVTEAVASMLKWRSDTLLKGIESVLNDSDFTGLANSMYNHALVNPRADGKARTEADLKVKPTYVNPKQFAAALIDVMNIVEDAPAKMKAGLDANVPDPQLNQLLKGIVDRTGGKLDRIQQELAIWFDSAMDRVGGAYKRKTQLVSFIIAFLLAVALNVDTIHIAEALWKQPMLPRTVEVKQGETPTQTLEKLNAYLPTGWTAESTRRVSQQPIVAFFGWLFTAFAALFGAPFWFDALQRITRLKGSGPAPATKARDVGASA